MAFCAYTNIVPYLTGLPGAMHLQIDLIDGPPTINDPGGSATCTLPGSPFGHSLQRFSTAYTSVIVDGITYYPSDTLHGGPPYVSFVSDQRIWVPCRDVDNPGDLGPAIIITIPSDDPTHPNAPQEINVPPTADPASYTTYAETALSITLGGSAGSGIGPLVYEIVTGASHGNVTGTPPDLTYTPANNWIGTDTFTFRVNDQSDWSEPATITVDTYPIVTGIDPVTGPEGGGTPVTLSGRGLHDTSTVAFGGAQATAVVVAANGHSITCVSPAHAPGLVSVVDTGPNHTASSAIAAAQSFTYYHIPDLNGSPPWQTEGQWALHRFDMRPRKEGPA